MTLSFLIILGSRNANIPFIVSAKITCSWIIIASFIYKGLIKNDRSRCNYWICESCWEGKTWYVGICTGQTWNENHNSFFFFFKPFLFLNCWHHQFLTLNSSLYSNIDMLYTTSFSYQLLTFGSTTDPVLPITTEHMPQHLRQKKCWLSCKQTLYTYLTAFLPSFQTLAHIT